MRNPKARRFAPMLLGLTLPLTLLLGAAAWKLGGPDTGEAGPAPVAAPSDAADLAPDTSPSPTASASPAPRRIDRRKLAKAIEKAVKGDARVSVSVSDLTDGTSYTYGASRRFVTASIVKVDILAALLLQAQEQGRALTASEKSLATRMIEDSDNAAANALWSAIGGAAGLAKADRRLGLKETTATSVSWGLTSTSARDQVRLLNALVSGDGPLSKRSRRYVLGLMSRVNTTQDWGVSAGAAAGDAVALKNGWLPRSADGGLWVINSIGRIEGDHDYSIAVLSDRNASMDAGVALVETVTEAVLDELS
ncbi:MAG TPA: serine hydrolase [Spirillospora sp.]|nr:serine hydrolase [Spirillospora sp.]